MKGLPVHYCRDSCFIWGIVEYTPREESVCLVGGI